MVKSKTRVDTPGMDSTEDAESTSSTGIGERWARLDRGWRAVALGLLVVGLHWVVQTV